MPPQRVKSGHHGGRGKCSACLLPLDQQEQLNAALVAGVPLHRLSKRWTINRESLRAHKANHVSPAQVALRTERITNGVRKVSERVEDLVAATTVVLDGARDGRNAFMALKAIREQRANYELLARITGELNERPQVTVNLQSTQEWNDIRSLTVEFVPVARRPEFARRLKELDERRRAHD